MNKPSWTWVRESATRSPEVFYHMQLVKHGKGDEAWSQYRVTHPDFPITRESWEDNIWTLIHLWKGEPCDS